MLNPQAVPLTWHASTSHSLKKKRNLKFLKNLILNIFYDPFFFYLLSSTTRIYFMIPLIFLPLKLHDLNRQFPRGALLECAVNFRPGSMPPSWLLGTSHFWSRNLVLLELRKLMDHHPLRRNLLNFIIDKLERDSFLLEWRNLILTYLSKNEGFFYLKP